QDHPSQMKGKRMCSIFICPIPFHFLRRDSTLPAQPPSRLLIYGYWFQWLTKMIEKGPSKPTDCERSIDTTFARVRLPIMTMLSRTIHQPKKKPYGHSHVKGFG